MSHDVEKIAVGAKIDHARQNMDKLAIAERLFRMLADEDSSMEIATFAMQSLSAKFSGPFDAQKRLLESLGALGAPHESWVNWAGSRLTPADSGEQQAKLSAMAEQSGRAASRLAMRKAGGPRLLKEALALGWGPLMFWSSQAPMGDASCEIAAKLAMNGSHEAFLALDAMIELGFPIFNADRGDDYFPLGLVFADGSKARCKALIRHMSKDVAREDERLSKLAIASHPLTPVVRELALEEPQLWAKARGFTRSGARASVLKSCISVASALLAAGDEEAFMALAMASPDDTLNSCQSDAKKWRAKRTLLGNVVNLGGDPDKTLAILSSLGGAWLASAPDGVLPLHEMADLGEAGLSAAARLMSLGEDPRARSISGSTAIGRALKTLSLADLRSVYGAEPEDISNALEDMAGVSAGALAMALRMARGRRYATSGGNDGEAEEKERVDAERHDRRLLEIFEFASQAPNGISAASLWEMLEEAGGSGLPLCFGAVAKSLAERGLHLKAKNFDWIEKDGPFGQAHEAGIAMCLEIGWRAGADLDEPFIVERGMETTSVTLFERALLAFSDMDVLYGQALPALIGRARTLIEMGAGRTGSKGDARSFIQSAQWRDMDSEGKEVALGLMAELESSILAQASTPSASGLGQPKKRFSL